MAYIPLADQDEDLHDHPHSFITKYVWSQDHKVIAIQYGSTAIAVGLVGLAPSILMRLQLAATWICLHLSTRLTTTNL